MATKLNLDPQIVGDIITFKITVTGAGDIANDVMIFTVKDDSADADVDAALQVKLTVPSDADAANSIAWLAIQPSDTASVVAGSYFYDIQWVDPQAAPEPAVQTLIYGKVKFIQDITKDIA